MSHLPIYNYVAAIILYIQGCGLYYCFRTARVPTRNGWLVFGLLGLYIGLFAAGMILLNWISYMRG